MSKVNKIKEHFKRNKKEYITGGVCLVVGAAGAVLSLRNTALINTKAVQVLTWKSNQTIEVHIEALGDPGNIIQDTATGDIWASQNQAAKALGVTASRVSSHLKGKQADVDGHVLTKLGKAHVSQ